MVVIVTQLRYNRNMNNKQPTSLRLTPEAKRLLSELAKKLGVTQAAIVEIAIRRLAEVENVQ
jgi:predicted DNA-binding protein